MVKVLNSGHTCDRFLGACAGNIWFQAALGDIKYVHVLRSNNQTTDLLSRWDFSADHYNKLQTLSESALSRIRVAYRPKTQRSYEAQFRTFMAFCVCMKINVLELEVAHILCFMEFLVNSNVSVSMIQNYLFALKAKFIFNQLDHHVLADQKMRLYVKCLKINRPLNPVTRNIMTIKVLKHLTCLCDTIFMGSVYKAIFLVAFFAFLRLSNMTPHSIALSNPSRHLSASDVTFTSQFLKINL